MRLNRPARSFCPVLLLIWLCIFGKSPASEKPAVYLWQRTWTPSVREALQQRATNFSLIVPLKTEIAFKQSAQASVIRVPIDYNALQGVTVPIGLALRIGPFTGPFATTNQQTQLIISEASRLVREAETNGLHIAELHIDFDCAESKLAGYTVWVTALKARLPGVPIVITALPTWLNHQDFAPLARAAGLYVLQVHSFERPTTFDAPVSLCDPQKARRAVMKADQIGVPFRIALPMYTYTLAFDQKGIYVGLSAEGRAKKWPTTFRTKELGANASEIAELVQDWNLRPPQHLRGMIWYRMPIQNDAFNWRWPTLEAVMHGRTPEPHLRLKAQRTEKELIEIRLQNDGTGETNVPKRIVVHWAKTKLIAADALRGFEIVDTTPQTVHFRPRQFLPPLILKPGDECLVGWLRFTQEAEVECEMLPK